LGGTVSGVSGTRPDQVSAAESSASTWSRRLSSPQSTIARRHGALVSVSGALGSEWSQSVPQAVGTIMRAELETTAQMARSAARMLKNQATRLLMMMMMTVAVQSFSFRWNCRSRSNSPAWTRDQSALCRALAPFQALQEHNRSSSPQWTETG
jgi:hypothetical protein